MQDCATNTEPLYGLKILRNKYQMPGIFNSMHKKDTGLLLMCQDLLIKGSMKLQHNYMYGT